jgi:hypothetical protein
MLCQSGKEDEMFGFDEHLEIKRAVEESEGWIDEAIRMTEYDGDDAPDYPDGHYLITLRKTLKELKNQFKIAYAQYPAKFLEICELEEKEGEEMLDRADATSY